MRRRAHLVDGGDGERRDELLGEGVGRGLAVLDKIKGGRERNRKGMSAPRDFAMTLPAPHPLKQEVLS